MIVAARAVPVMLLIGGLGSPAEAADLDAAIRQLEARIEHEFYDQAVTDGAALLSLAEQEYGPVSREVARVSYLLAEAHRFRGDGRDPSTLAFAERALEIYERDPLAKGLELADALHQVAYLMLYQSQDPRRARKYLQRALVLFEDQAPADDPRVSDTLINLGWADFNCGDFSAAIADYERAGDLLEQSGGMLQEKAAYLNGLGTTYAWSGRYREARPILERAVRAWERLGPDAAEGQVLARANLAALMVWMGEKEAAEPYLRRTLKLCEESLGDDHDHAAWVLINLAEVSYLSHDPGAAVEMTKRAVRIRERQGRSTLGVANALYRLGFYLDRTGRRERAQRAFERAIEIYARHGFDSHPNLARVLLASAEALHGSGRLEDAARRYARAATMIEETLGPEHPLLATTLSSWASALHTLGDDKALATSLLAESIGREHLRLTAQALPEARALAYAASRPSGADLALTIAAEGASPAEASSVWNEVIRSRAVVLDEMAARRRALGDSPEISQAADELADARRRLANLTLGRRSDTFQPPPEAIRQARTDRQRAEERLAHLSAGFRGFSVQRGVGWAEVSSTLPPDAALVAYVRYGYRSAVDRYLAFVLPPGEAEPRIVPLGSAEEIDRRVNEWRSAAGTAPPRLRSARREAEQAYSRAGAALRRRVWDPLAGFVGSANLVLIVPDGSLHMINLGTLPAPTPNRFLMENAPPFHYLSAERDLVRDGEPRGEGAGSLLAIGGSDYDAPIGPPDVASVEPAVATLQLRADVAPYRSAPSGCASLSAQRFAELPGTLVETREVVEVWKRTVGVSASRRSSPLALTGGLAHEALFKSEAPRRQVLHVATHGFFVQGDCSVEIDENPLLLSGLVLAGANNRAHAGPDEEDGLLTAEEIASLDLSGVRWAVLSACETGAGGVVDGEGVFGLRRAFEIAGVDTLIMSLWSVQDDMALRWMRGLYEARLGRGLTAAESVRQASLAVLEQRREAGQGDHPFHWGAFVATGDWR